MNETITINAMIDAIGDIDYADGGTVRGVLLKMDFDGVRAVAQACLLFKTMRVTFESLAPMVGAEGGAGCPAVNQTEPGPVVGGSPARASLDGWSIAPDPNSGTCEVRAPNGSVWTLGQHRAYGDDESEAST